MAGIYRYVTGVLPRFYHYLDAVLLFVFPCVLSVPSVIKSSGILVSTSGSGMLVSMVGSMLGIIAGVVVGAVVGTVVGAVVAGVLS